MLQVSEKAGRMPSGLQSEALDLGLHGILTAPLAGCVAWGKILDLSESLPPHHGKWAEDDTVVPAGRSH